MDLPATYLVRTGKYPSPEHWRQNNSLLSNMTSAYDFSASKGWCISINSIHYCSVLMIGRPWPELFANQSIPVSEEEDGI